MPNPSSVDDTDEMNTPLLYGIISIPSGRASNKHYRIRTTVVAHDGYQNRRYFPQSWDFIDLPVASEIQEYRDISYAPICETQVKRLVYTPPLQQAQWNKNSKWLQPAGGSTTYTYQPKTLFERLTIVFENLMMTNPSITVADIEKELPTVLAALATENTLFTYDRYDSVDVADPFFYDSY
jgi:hypothetical protein